MGARITPTSDSIRSCPIGNWERRSTKATTAALRDAASARGVFGATPRSRSRQRAVTAKRSGVGRVSAKTSELSPLGSQRGEARGSLPTTLCLLCLEHVSETFEAPASNLVTS